MRLGRLCLGAGQWRVTLDELADSDDIRKRLNAAGGYGVTHVGRLERLDGAPFTLADADQVLNAVAVYSSFACGRWTGPVLPVGYGADGDQVWDHWRGSRIDSYASRQTWMDTGDPKGACYTGPFAGFYGRWCDPFWRDVVHAAVHWYVESCGCAGSVEGSIVLTQAAFELLSSVVLVETERWLGPDGYDKLPAADKLRLLLRWARVPGDLPPELPELCKAAKANNWTDLSAGLTAVRNMITHPTPRNRKAADRLSSNVHVECWSAGLWCLELCLLRVFNYTGRYGDRLRQRFAGQTVSVPWATPELVK